MAHGGSYLLKMSEETFDFVCTTCARDDKTIEAVKYCVECSGYCCQPCTDAHKKFPALTRHNLIEVSQVNQTSRKQTSLLELPTERCSIHKVKVVDMYCGKHDVVGCYVCIANDHKTCKDSRIHSIPDMIDTLFKLSDCKQTHSLLKDMVVSMETVSKSKDGQLQTLYKAKKEAIDNVTTSQKALEALIRKAAESSRKDVEAAYKELENEIPREKQNAKDICEDLKATDDKLNESEGNRAQKFTCSKLAQEKIKQADREKSKQEKHQQTDVHITFIPDHSLMKYIKAAKGIGKVQKQEQRKKQKQDLYKIKESGDINLRDDSSGSWFNGICLTHDNHLLVTDYYNKKLKRIDVQKLSVVDYCTLDSNPNGVCCVGEQEVAVACENDGKIQFVSIHNKMTPTRQIKMSHDCYGIAFNNHKIYVTDDGKNLYVYDIIGTRLKTISHDKTGKKLFDRTRCIKFNESGNRMFVGGWGSGLLCFDGMGNHLSTITDDAISCVTDVCFDGRGNMFVVGWDSRNVVQFKENGKKVGEVVNKNYGLLNPLAMCFHQGLNKMFVTMYSDTVLKMYELK